MLLFFVILYTLLSIFLYRATYRSMQSLYVVIHHTTDSDYAAKVGIAAFYFPGTLIHESSHLLAAMALFLKIHSVSIFPVIEHGGVKLGSVTYYKRDPVRSILVGIAPLFGGTATAYGLYLILGYTDVFWIRALVIYLLFTIMSTMFSSAQDLVDVVWLVPLCMLVVIVGYILGIDVSTIYTFLTHTRAESFFRTVSLLAFASLGIHAVGIVAGKWITKTVRSR